MKYTIIIIIIIITIIIFNLKNWGILEKQTIFECSKTPTFLFIPNFSYRVHNNLPDQPALSEFSAEQGFVTYFRFNIIFLLNLTFPKWVISSFPTTIFDPFIICPTRVYNTDFGYSHSVITRERGTVAQQV